MNELPRVTVIVVTQDPAGPLEGGLTGPVLAALHSVECQDYPADLMDISVVRDVDNHGLRAMRDFGVKKAETEWVAFIGENETWDPDRLRTLMGVVARRHTTGAGWTAVCRPVLMRKEAYLEGMSDGQ